MKTAIHFITGMVFAVCLMTVLLITSVQAVIYWTPGYFEREYAKYGVTETVNMTMKDLLDVTDQMMAYLQGKRDDLHVKTTVGGVSREFFNAREIAHMEDVKGLFLNALALRRGCILIMALCLISLFLLKTDWKRIFPQSILIGTGVFFGASALLAAVISTDFNKYFIMFHHMFFHNDLWILNPATDLLINIVPEGFFNDTVRYIGLTFFALWALVFGFSLFFLRKWSKK